MIRGFAYSIIAMIFFISAGNAGAVSLQVRAIYEKAALSPKTMMPFIVQDLDGGEVKVLNVKMTQDRGLCGMVVDPFNKNVFLLKCMEPVPALALKIIVEVAGSTYESVFGPIEIKYQFDNLKIWDTSKLVDDPDVLKGQQLFGSYCIRCHLTERPPASTTVSIIRAKMISEPKMKSDPDIKALTDAQLLLIVKFLGIYK